jgi:hypothetical protein
VGTIWAFSSRAHVGPKGLGLLLPHTWMSPGVVDDLVDDPGLCWSRGCRFLAGWRWELDMALCYHQNLTESEVGHD